MDILNLKNLQLSYQAVYDETLCESMEDLGIIGEAKDGYGEDSKFKQDTDADSFIPGKTVPKVKKYGRISRYSPMGGQRSRTASNVTRTVGDDEGAPRAVKMYKGKKMVKRDGKWVKEAYDIVLEHLIEGRYATSTENAKVIMANMSEEWIESIVEKYI